MGKDNRQRRAAKQRRRDQQQRQRAQRHERDATLAQVLWHAVDVIVDGDADDTRVVLEVLETFPSELDGAIADAASQACATATRHGWSDDDLTELRARRLKVPPGASAREREVRWLALLSSIPPLPAVAPRRPTSSGDDAMLAKIRALLAKAESTTFPEEAEALSAKAQELMARHRIDHVLVDGDADEPVGRRIWLDDPYADAKAQLLAAVAATNACRSVMLTGLGCAHVTGFPTDLDVVELLHTSLLVQATSAMAAAGPQRDGRGRSRTRSFRQSFLTAYAWRIGERLQETTDAVVADAGAAEPTLLPALVRREHRVEDAVARAFPSATVKRTSISNAAGFAAGTIAADTADLSIGPPLPE